MASETDTAFQPPYMSWATFESIVEQFRAVGLPAQIDRSVLRSRSGGDQSQFLRAASGFGFIDGNGAPTERFREYVRDQDARPRIMQEVLRETYPSVVSLPADATPQMLNEQFRALGVEGDTARKAIAFYLNAARFADVPLSPHFKATRPGAGGRKGRRQSVKTAKGGSGDDAELPPLPPPSPLSGLHPAIVTLVGALPPASMDGKPEFPQAERDAWFAYAQATFNLIYKLPSGDAGGAS